MNDYAQPLLDIKHLREQAHKALQEGRWADACDLADEIVDAARKVRLFCLDKMRG